jgi:two-component system, cell cycle response regulator
MAGKILVIDSVMPNRIILKVKLSGAGYDVAVAASGREGLEIAIRMRPDLIILDMDIADMPCEMVMEQTRTIAQLQNLLVIMVSARDDMATRLRAHRAGCDEFYAKPLAENTLLARIRSFLRDDDQLRVLAASDEQYFMHHMAADGFEEEAGTYDVVSRIVVVGAQEPALRLKHKLPAPARSAVSVYATDALMNANTLPFEDADVVVVIADLADPIAALHIISKLRARAETRDARYCVQFEVGARDADRDLVLDFGADCILQSDDNPEEVTLRLSSLIKRKHRADDLRARIKHGLMLSAIDPLTNIPNRRFMNATLRAMVGSAASDNSSVGIIVCDIDRFKSVNDRFGHATGDFVLIETAKRLQGALREGDVIARVGGEEFLIALPAATMGNARAVAERLVAAVRDKPFELPGGAQLQMTISAGLAIAQPAGEMPLDALIERVIDAADQALLLSKAQGRNKVTLGRSAA